MATPAADSRPLNHLQRAMTEAGSYKWVEVLLLLLAGAGFFWWQFADLRRARQKARKAQEEAAQQSATGTAKDDGPPQS